jgi:hypothetical protein
MFVQSAELEFLRKVENKSSGGRNVRIVNFTSLSSQNLVGVVKRKGTGRKEKNKM